MVDDLVERMAAQKADALVVLSAEKRVVMMAVLKVEQWVE